MENKPLLSIITIVYNHKDGFKATAESLKNIKNNMIEWIVVDGSSKDGTVDMIKKYENYINSWVSEKDKGIADAFNKGVKLSNGGFIIFLNAGDILCIDENLIINYINDNKESPSIVGKIKINNQEFGRDIPFWRQYMRNHLPHQAMLINKKCFEEYGYYDVEKKLGMDYEWSLRLFKVWSKIVFIPEVISIMEPGGISISNPLKTFKDYHNSRVNHFDMRLLSFAILIFYYFKVLILRPLKNIFKKS